MRQPGLFDISRRLEALSSCGDPLERLGRLIDFEIFRTELEEVLVFSSNRQKGGRPPYDVVLMFKVLILQSLYTLSDEQTEYQIKDRLSFMRFLKLGFHHSVPDAKTIWLYRERLKKAGAVDRFFEFFDRVLKENGYFAMSGQIVDASIIKVPRQRMTREEKETVKAGDIPQSWQDKPAKLVQKDRDARWTVKYTKAKGETGIDLAIPYFGYKNHVSIDKRYGFIRKFKVTDASQYDGKMLPHLLDSENTACGVWGDTAYRSETNERLLIQQGFRSQIHRKKPKGKLMPHHIRCGNQKRSRVRSSVEHVFAAQKERMGLFIRTVGLARAHVKLTLANLTYNMQRLVFWETRCALTG